MTKILLADDHKIVRQGIRRLLEDNVDFTIVGEAADGFEALEIISEQPPDVLVTDLRMPRMGGLELIKKVRNSYPGIKLVVLSMYTSEAYVYSALSAGADAYVVKQLGIQKLDTAIETVLQGEKYLSPPVTRNSIDVYAKKNNIPSICWV